MQRPLLIFALLGQEKDLNTAPWPIGLLWTRSEVPIGAELVVIITIQNGAR
jgi:hypothetical protein